MKRWKDLTYILEMSLVAISPFVIVGKQRLGEATALVETSFF